MGLFNLIARLRGDQEKLPNLADVVAARSLDAVWPLVQPRLANLTANEMRGYVRARGRSVLKVHIRHAADLDGGLSHSSQERLFDLASASLTKLVDTRHRTAQAVGQMRRRAA